MPSVSSTVERKTRFALNVTVAPGSGAEAVYRRSVAVAAAVPAAAEIPIAGAAGAVAGGQAPSPADDLHYKGGKILPDLTFTNFFVGGQDQSRSLAGKFPYPQCCWSSNQDDWE